MRCDRQRSSDICKGRATTTSTSSVSSGSDTSHVLFVKLKTVSISDAHSNRYDTLATASVCSLRHAQVIRRVYDHAMTLHPPISSLDLFKSRSLSVKIKQLKHWTYRCQKADPWTNLILLLLYIYHIQPPRSCYGPYTV